MPICCRWCSRLPPISASATHSGQPPSSTAGSPMDNSLPRSEPASLPHAKIDPAPFGEGRTMIAHATLPDLLEKQLQRQAIAYQLRPLHEAGAAGQCIEACLLSDSQGALLTLIPSDHLLDLRRLSELSDRPLQP